MAIEQKDILFTLIKSLSKSEKRQFKLYVGRLGGNVNANFMTLFNRSEERRVGKSVDLGGRRIIKKKKKN